MKIIDLEEKDGVYIPVGDEHIIDIPTPAESANKTDKKKFVAVLMEKNQKFAANFKNFLAGVDAVISITNELRKRAKKVV